ncbi:MAG: hypothetical protein AB7F41_04615 [Methylocystis sp.]|uniref:hypothetical protein n=1 Tax=Methylocystis sp. TaxID=1911079 RepID=UPI003D12AF83
MLLPLMWLRKKKLDRLLKDYPLYDPPHKVEERLLPKAKAQENFEYFMRVRKERVAFFSRWLKDEFGVAIGPTQRGVEALNRWMFQYVGLLLPNRTVEYSYFSYDPPWRGDGAGCNVLFDVGIAFGEFLIANCPNLRWDMDPISALRPNEARIRKREFGLSFWRPMLTGFENPHWGVNPLHMMWTQAHLLGEITTCSGRWNFRNVVGGRDTRDLRNSLAEFFETKIREYEAGDPATLYGSAGIPADLEDDDG